MHCLGKNVLTKLGGRIRDKERRGWYLSSMGCLAASGQGCSTHAQPRTECPCGEALTTKQCLPQITSQAGGDLPLPSQGPLQSCHCKAQSSPKPSQQLDSPNLHTPLTAARTPLCPHSPLMPPHPLKPSHFPHSSPSPYGTPDPGAPTVFSQLPEPLSL